MTTYYRVNLQDGITTETQKTGFYSGSPELNVTVFKSVRAAKRTFNDITKAEIERLHALRLKIRALKTREELIAGEELASHVEAD